MVETKEVLQEMKSFSNILHHFRSRRWCNWTWILKIKKSVKLYTKRHNKEIRFSCGFRYSWTLEIFICWFHDSATAKDLTLQFSVSVNRTKALKHYAKLIIFYWEWGMCVMLTYLRNEALRVTTYDINKCTVKDLRHTYTFKRFLIDINAHIPSCLLYEKV